MGALSNLPKDMQLVWRGTQSLALEAKFVSSILRGLGTLTVLVIADGSM